MNRSRRLLRAFSISVLLAAAFQHAKAEGPTTDYLWDHPEEAVASERDLAFTFEKFAHTQNESIFLMGYFNDGWVIMYSVFHINAAVLNRWGMYALVADPEGNRYWMTNSPNNRDIEMGEDRFSYNDGTTVIEATEDKLSIVSEFDGFACDLVFNKRIPSWTPGTGTEYYSEKRDTYQHKVVFVPLADLTGHIQIGERRVEVEGEGYGEKSLFINPLIRQQPYLHAMRLYTPRTDPVGVHIGLHQVVLNKMYGERELTRLVLAIDDKWIFTTRNYEFTPLKYRHPEKSPYRYPSSFRLFAEKNGYVLEGTVTERRFFDITDVFFNLPNWVKSILTAFFNRPVYFRYVSEFNGTLTSPDGTIRPLLMSGPYEYVVVY